MTGKLGLRLVEGSLLVMSLSYGRRGTWDMGLTIVNQGVVSGIRTFFSDPLLNVSARYDPGHAGSGIVKALSRYPDHA